MVRFSPSAVAFAINGNAAPLVTSASFGMGSFAVAGFEANYTRDFEAWFPRPFDTDGWRGNFIESEPWTGKVTSSGAWLDNPQRAETWTPAIIHPKTWTAE
jgi:hypothetical protein